MEIRPCLAKKPATSVGISATRSLLSLSSAMVMKVEAVSMGVATLLMPARPSSWRSSMFSGARLG
ncbi:hypothetical protein CEY11_20450 [Candidimonas nitroreducens]|uniref:Uncharacterized protein n=1 Tax=Candidimonas nitroreducens TaxID=683354 RepID=A0A225M4S4_9BURK|nr:hypothetical protein CEY11_20450 [Candidimonas nitroreducens]